MSNKETPKGNIRVTPAPTFLPHTLCSVKTINSSHFHSTQVHPHHCTLHKVLLRPLHSLNILAPPKSEWSTLSNPASPLTKNLMFFCNCQPAPLLIFCKIVLFVLEVGPTLFPILLTNLDFNLFNFPSSL